MVPTRRLSVLTAGALAAGLLAGCSGPSFSFNRDDPSGYSACRDATASEQTDDDAQRERLLDSAAAQAAAAQTGDIRATVDPPVDEDALETVGADDAGTYTVDVEALLEACVAAGFEPDDVDLPGPDS